MAGFELYTPFRNYVVTSRFNAPRNYSFAPNRKQLHEGEDSVDGNSGHGENPPVYCGHDGIVVKVGYDGRGYGNYCVIDFGDGWSAWYAHFKIIDVAQGQHVKAKERLGYMGETGMATGEHCHLNLCNQTIGLDNYVVAKVLDPSSYLKSW